MRILLFHQYFLGKNDPGGSRWNEFTNYFTRDSKITVDVIAGNIHYATGKRVGDKVWYNQEIIKNNLIVHRTWTYSGYNSNFLGRVIGYLSYMFSAFWRGMRLEKPDVIIISSPSIFVGVSAILLSKIKRVPFIFEVRDLWPESAVATGVLNNKFLLNILYWLEYRLYKNSNKIVVLTPAFKDNIESRFHEFVGKIDIITNGADFSLMNNESKREEIRNRYGWGDKKVFGYFGAHGVANDLIQVIEVAKVFKDDNRIHFVLIGDGMQKDMLKSKAKEYGLKNITFIDSISKTEVSNYIDAIDVGMAILKKTDTFKTVYPNKVFDYMSCKKPILATIDGITKELIQKADCGFYSEPENLNSFIKTIEKFISIDKKELDKLGENGYNYVKENFNREILSKDYLKIIKQVTN